VKTFQQQGIHLFDLLLGLLLLGILLGYVLPNYQQTLEIHRQAAELNRLQGILASARLQASLLNQTLIVCTSDNGQSCQSNTNNRGGLLLTNETHQPLQHFPGHGHPVILPQSELELRPLPNRGSGGTLLPCTGFRYQPARGITLSPAGRIRVNSEPPEHLKTQCPH
jgi:type II secretory pathway pseudopilin PulG